MTTVNSKVLYEGVSNLFHYASEHADFNRLMTPVRDLVEQGDLVILNHTKGEAINPLKAAGIKLMMLVDAVLRVFDKGLTAVTEPIQKAVSDLADKGKEVVEKGKETLSKILEPASEGTEKAAVKVKYKQGATPTGKGKTVFQGWSKTGELEDGTKYVQSATFHSNQGIKDVNVDFSINGAGSKPSTKLEAGTVTKADDLKAAAKPEQTVDFNAAGDPVYIKQPKPEQKVDFNAAGDPIYVNGGPKSAPVPAKDFEKIAKILDV